MSERTLRIATRESLLALWQAEYIKARLEACHPGRPSTTARTMQSRPTGTGSRRAPVCGPICTISRSTRHRRYEARINLRIQRVPPRTESQTWTRRRRWQPLLTVQPW